jgi:hypothetical protein
MNLHKIDNIRYYTTPRTIHHRLIDIRGYSLTRCVSQLHVKKRMVISWLTARDLAFVASTAVENQKCSDE